MDYNVLQIADFLQKTFLWKFSQFVAFFFYFCLQSFMCIFFFYKKDGKYGKNVRFQMWSLIISKITQRYLGYLTLPAAIVVGTIGYKIEQHWSTPKQIPYLNHSVLDERLDREMSAGNTTTTDFNMLEEKSRIVPASSLNLNTSRNH